MAGGRGFERQSNEVDLISTEAFNLAEVGGVAIDLGQEDMAGSIPVVLASDQSAIPVTLSPTDTDDDSIAKEQVLPLFINENYIFAKTADRWVRQQGTDDGYPFVRTVGLFDSAGVELNLDASGDVQSDILSVIPGYGATNLGKRIGDPVGATDVGVMALARVSFEPSRTSDDDGDYDHLDLSPWHELITRDQREKTIQDCNDYTEVTALGNDTANLADSVNHVFGTGSISFDKVNGAANTVYAGFSWDMGNVNIQDIFESGAFVAMGVYFPALTNVVAVGLRLGTDSTNYNYWEWSVDDLQAGMWIPLRKPTNSPSGYAGNGWNTNDIDYGAFYVKFNNETNALSGMVVDNIHFIGGRVTDSTIDTTVSSSVTTPNINVHRMGGTPTDTNTGNASAGTQRVAIATDDINLSAIKTAVQLIDDTIYTDDTSTHATGTSKGVGIMAVAEPTDTSIGANDIGMPSMTTTRFLKVINQANSGVDIGDVTINNASGSAVYVQPGAGITFTVDAVNFDIRDLDYTTDDVKVYGSQNAVLQQKVTTNDLIVTLDGESVAVTNADITACKTALQLIDNAVDGNYLNINQNIAGTDVAANNGTANAQTQRVTIASDSTGQVGLVGSFPTFGQTTTANITATQISSTSTTIRRITIKNLPTSNCTIYIGGSGVTTSTGYPLLPGESRTWDGSFNRNQWYFIKSSTQNTGVAYEFQT